MLLPNDHLAKHFLDRFLVADEVIVDDECEFETGGAQCLELSDHLLGAFDAWPPAEGDDDVAELALERAPARELEASKCIVAHLEQVEPRCGNAQHVGLFT